MGNKTALTADEVCRILNACGRARVVELKFGDLQVCFGKTTETVVTPGQKVLDMSNLERPPHPAPVTEMTGPPKNIESRVKTQQELALREDQLELMRLEDPAGYEELIANGDLTEEQVNAGDEEV